MLDLEELYNRKDLENAITAHKKALSNRRLDEDRRLFYVALTRTERALFISAHHWAESGSEPKGAFGVPGRAASDGHGRKRCR